jgi:hypothetical protein
MQWRTQDFFPVGVQQIRLRADGRENGDLRAVVPLSGAPLNLQMSETRILIGLLRMFSTELENRFSFFKTSEFRWEG